MMTLVGGLPGWLGYVLIGAVVVGHRFVLSTRKEAWWGALLPIAWVVVVAISIAQGRNQAVGDWVRDAVVFLVLVGMAVMGQEGRAKRSVRKDS